MDHSTVHFGFSLKKRQQKDYSIHPVEETVYCLATECKFMSGIQCTGHQEDVLGNSSKGFHLFRNPDVLIYVDQVHGEPSCEILQCKVG